jgi:hypothetical protein
MTPKLAAGRHRAGPNLYRQIAASGAGSWVLRYEMRGVKRWMGLGPLAVFSLKEAQQRAREAQQQIYSGVDDARRNQRATEARKAILTIDFASATQAYFDQHQTKWGHKARTEFLNTLAAYAFPIFGQLPVDQIDTPLVLRAIEPNWLSRHVTANRVRGRIEAVLDWCRVAAFLSALPSASVSSSLFALSFSAVSWFGVFLRERWRRDAAPTTARSAGSLREP